MQRIYKRLKEGRTVILDDLRFNEMEALQGAGAITVHLERKDAPYASVNHAGEQGLDRMDFTCFVQNNGSLTDLQAEAVKFVDWALAKRQAA